MLTPGLLPSMKLNASEAHENPVLLGPLWRIRYTGTIDETSFWLLVIELRL